MNPIRLAHALGGPTYLMASGDRVVIRVAFDSEDLAVDDHPSDEPFGHLRADGAIIAEAGHWYRGMVYRFVGPRGEARWVYRGERVSGGPVWERA